MSEGCLYFVLFGLFVLSCGRVYFSQFFVAEMLTVRVSGVFLSVVCVFGVSDYGI